MVTFLQAMFTVYEDSLVSPPIVLPFQNPPVPLAKLNNVEQVVAGEKFGNLQKQIIRDFVEHCSVTIGCA